MRPWRWGCWAAALVAACGGTADGGGSPDDAGPDADPTGCAYGGQAYQIGDSFPAADDCNTCFCEASGTACTLMLCPSGDAGPVPDAGPTTDAGPVTDAGPTADTGPAIDPRAIDVWYFDIPTDAVRFYEIALCAGGRARLWTSFGGAGNPDQVTPIDGTYVSGGPDTVQITFEVPTGLEELGFVALAYGSDTDRMNRVDAPDAGMSWMGNTGIRLAPLSSVTVRLAC